jgi:hypothetical protein
LRHLATASFTVGLEAAGLVLGVDVLGVDEAGAGVDVELLELELDLLELPQPAMNALSTSRRNP